MQMEQSSSPMVSLPCYWDVAEAHSNEPFDLAEAETWDPEFDILESPNLIWLYLRLESTQ
jgi:hypothetical protein